MKKILFAVFTLFSLVISAENAWSYESEIRKEFPFAGHKVDDQVSFATVDGVKVSGKVLRLNERGVMVEDSTGVGFFYNRKQLGTVGGRLFYQDDYEKWVVKEADARSRQIVTKDGQVYRECSIGRVTPEGLSITHEKGNAVIPFDNLPDELPPGFRDGFREAKQKEAERSRLEKEEKLRQSLSGYRLGDTLEEKNMLEKSVNGYFVKPLSPWIGEDRVEVAVTADGGIYSIKVYLRALSQKDFQEKENQLKQRISELDISDNKRFFYRDTIDFRELTTDGLLSQEEEKVTGEIFISLLDLRLEPISAKASRLLKKEHDEMKKKTHYRPRNAIEHKNRNEEYSLSPVITVENDGKKSFWLTCSYYSLRPKYGSSRWMFFTEIILMTDKGESISFTTDNLRRSDSVTDYGVLEIASFRMRERLAKLRETQTLRVRFSGKFKHDYDLTPAEIDSLHAMIDFYNEL